MRSARPTQRQSAPPIWLRYSPLILAVVLSAFVYARVSADSPGVFDLEGSDVGAKFTPFVTVNTGLLWPDSSEPRPTWRAFFAAYSLEDKFLQKTLREYEAESGRSVSECDYLPERREIKIYLRADLADDNFTPSADCSTK